MAATFDLRQLMVERDTPRATPASRPRRLLARYVLPLSMLAAFAALSAWAARDQFLPAQPVSVVSVVVSRAPVSQSGTPLFRAAGWIEPRPSPVLVTALAEGVVDRLLVVEGQEVTVGEELARLKDEDARLALAQAEAELALKRADLTSAEAGHAAAQTMFDKPVHLQAALAEVESACARVGRELANLPFTLRAAQARHGLARQTWQRQSRVSEVVSGQALQQAKSELAAAEAAVEELAASRRGYEQEQQALERQRRALEARLELKTDERRRVQEAKAAVSAAEARLRQAELAVEAARLRLERMTIRSPISGRVLALHAQPGRRLMGLELASAQDSSTILSLYDPALLQVRADVRLEDLPQVHPGQAVRIETASVEGNFDGVVSMATSQADIQKNTLQVKVSVTDPPPVLKPDMLVQVTFLSAAKPASQSNDSEDRWRLFVPKQLVEQTTGGAHVWIADRASGVARRQKVTLGPAVKNDLTEVAEGLSPTDKLIARGGESLEEGDRILITGEEPGIGLASQTP